MGTERAATILRRRAYLDNDEPEWERASGKDADSEQNIQGMSAQRFAHMFKEQTE